MTRRSSTPSGRPGHYLRAGTTLPAVDAAITIDDVDSPTLVGAIVRITNFHNGDLLNFADQGGHSR